MRTFVLLLAISATILTKGWFMTTKAKMNGMTTKAKMNGMTPVPEKLCANSGKCYGNPFLNGYIPKCRDDEQFHAYGGDGGLLISECRPMVKDSDECPAAPPGGNITPTKNSSGNGFSYCYLDCSDSKSICPTGSFCDGWNRCSYKQPDQKPYQKPDPAEATFSYEDGYSDHKTCNSGEVFREDTVDGETYGRCKPKVKYDSPCSATPLGIYAFVTSGSPDSDGNKECSLRCDGIYNLTCPLGSQCIKNGNGLSYCSYLESPTKQNFNNPFDQDPENPQCNEAGGADAVQFTTKDGKKLGMCAPKAPKDIQCPLYDTSEDHRRVSKAVGTHCQLPCDSNTDCAGGSQCLTINDDGKDRKICLYNTPVSSKTHDEFESSYPTADRLMLKPRDE